MFTYKTFNNIAEDGLAVMASKNIKDVSENPDALMLRSHKLLADFLELDIRVPASTESTATGAAITAGIGFGVFSPKKVLEKSFNQPTIYSPRESILDIADREKWKQFLELLMQAYS